MTTTDTMTLNEAAQNLLKAGEAHNMSASTLAHVRNTASKTPTGRLTKIAKQTIAEVEQRNDETYNAYLAAVEDFRQALYADRLAEAGPRRYATIAELFKITGGKEITHLYEANYDAYLASRNETIAPEKNGYKTGNTLVFDITPDDPAFKGVRSVSGYSNPVESFNDHKVHLKVYVDELGSLTNATVYRGALFDQTEHRSYRYLDDGFGIEVDRDPAHISLSSYNGTAEEVRVHIKVLEIVVNLIEKLNPLISERKRLEIYSETTLAKKVLGLA